MKIKNLLKQENPGVAIGDFLKRLERKENEVNEFIKKNLYK